MDSELGNLQLSRRHLLGKGARYGVGGAMLPAFLAACGGDGDSATTVAEATGATGAEGAPQQANTLMYAVRDTPEGFDIDQIDTDLSEQIGSSCYGGDIVRYNIVHDDEWDIDRADLLAPGNNGIDNGLAESIDVSDDGTVFTFHLRQDVTSGHGNPLTADDVIWSFERSFALESNGSFFANVMLVTPEGIKKIDDHTVEFKIERPNPLFLKIDAMKYQGGLFDSVAAKEHATADDPWAKEWLAENTAGFDAYHVDQVNKGQSLVLKANPGWYKGAPAFETVQWNVVPSAENRFALLLRGESDLALSLTPTQIEQAQQTEGLAVSSFVGNGLASMLINVHKGPLQDKRVRQAMAHAIPFDQIISSVYRDRAALLKSPIPPSYPGYTEEYFNYSDTGDIDTARKVLADANIDGFKMELLYDSSTFWGPLIGPIVKSSLEPLGINVELNGTTSAVVGEAQGSQNFDALLLEPHPFIADPGYALWVYFHGNSPINWVKWKNNRYDKLVDQNLTETDDEVRDKLTREAQQIWLDELPWIPLAAPQWDVVHRDTLEGVPWFSDGWVRVQELRPA